MRMVLFEGLFFIIVLRDVENDDRRVFAHVVADQTQGCLDFGH
jgi:hypothetical protein